MNLTNAREEEIKNVVAKEFFGDYDCTKIIGNIDFCVCAKPNLQKNQMVLWNEPITLIWAEAKRGTKQDIYASFVQLILTIGKASTFNKYTPPLFLVAFDAEKIAFLRWNKIQHIFLLNDFNWNITSSDHDNKYFKLLYSLIKDNLEKESLLFYYAQDEEELKEFIKENLDKNIDNHKIQIDKNNFYFVYLKWLEYVKPTISIPWEDAKRMEVLDVDFYLADLISDEDNSLLDSLRVILLSDKYKLRAERTLLGELFYEYGFTDNKRAYTRFWNRYERPPKKEYWDFIINRRDRLVPQDFRIRKGAFYTPQKWVELSQRYIAKVLGEDWQEEYYVWDCAAGTGNLLNGLTEKYRIYASTLDMSDVNVMQQRIKDGTCNLLENHVFQFDFLNDDFSKLPSSLQEIIKDKEKRKRLIIYINPPYAEAATTTTITGSGKHKTQVSNTTLTHEKYVGILQKGIRELFVQFFIRIYKEIPGCLLAEF
ncbi:MAG: N-6 DNA methylase, partial [Bacteroidota bacterium]|nr:N-6 DNA methylase [Bacteroidota bacterium]